MSIHKWGIFQIFPAFRVAFKRLVELNRSSPIKFAPRTIVAFRSANGCPGEPTSIYSSPYDTLKSRAKSFRGPKGDYSSRREKERVACYLTYPARRTVSAPSVASERISPC